MAVKVVVQSSSEQYEFTKVMSNMRDENDDIDLKDMYKKTAKEHAGKAVKCVEKCLLNENIETKNHL